MFSDESTGTLHQARGWAQECVADALDQLHDAVTRLTAEIGRAASLLSYGEEADAQAAHRDERNDLD